MATAAPQTATQPKGTFACFPFKFLFGNQEAKDMAKKNKQAASDAPTDSYGGGSSMMSVEGDAPGAGALAVAGASGATTAGGCPAGVRSIAGYEIRDTLGKGMSGKVKRGYNHGSDKSVALKIIDKQTTPRRVLQMLGTEIAAMKALDQHPNILSLLHYDMAATYPRKRGGTRDVVLLALDLAEGGELFDFMMYTGAFSEQIAKAIFAQLASALAFCHERGIYHRDIKPENLLLDGGFQLKVADFGLAAMRASPEELLRTECGTRSYMAPEVLARQQYDGSKADCWSAGVVLFIMLSGNPPFQMARPGDWWFNQFQEGRPDRFWKSHKRYTPNFPDAAQDVLTRVFTPNPAKRPAVKDLLAEPWLQSSSLTQADITKELAQRKQRITREKEAEKERARKKKATGQYGGNKKDIDPDKVKHRDINTGEAVPVAVAEEEPPAPRPSAEAAGNVTNLYTPEAPSVVMKRAKEALELMGAKGVAAKGAYGLKAVVPVQGAAAAVEVEVKVFSLPEEEGGVQLLAVLRREGDPLAFQKAFRAFTAHTTDLHGEGGGEEEASPVSGGKFGLGPEPLGDDEAEGNGHANGNGEAALVDDDGMI